MKPRSTVMGLASLVVLLAGCGGGASTAAPAVSTSAASAAPGVTACASWDEASVESMRLQELTFLHETTGGTAPTKAELSALAAATAKASADAAAAASVDPAFAALPGMITAADAVGWATYYDPDHATDMATTQARMAKVGDVDAWCAKATATG